MKAGVGKNAVGPGQNSKYAMEICKERSGGDLD